MEEINVKPKMHVFICTNDRSDTNPNRDSCSPTITRDQFKEVKLWLKEENLYNEIYCTRTHCLGFCNPDGGVLTIHPTNRFVKGVKMNYIVIVIGSKQK